jgi:hypothetical protein
MERYPIAPGPLLDEVNSWKGTDTHDTYMRKMSAANALRKQYDDPALLARIAIDAIRARRGDAPNGGPEKVRAKHAYLIRQ